MYNIKLNCRARVIKIRNNVFLFHLIVFLFLIISSCKKLVEVDPPVTALTTLSAFSNDNSAIAVMTGHYASMSNTSGAFSTGVSRFAALSSDDLTLWSGVSNTDQIAYYSNELFSTTDGSSGDEYWPYTEIYLCNTVIEGVNASVGLSVPIKNQLLGEAKFVRAFYFFYLVNLYGDIPLPLTTDFTVNRLLARMPKEKVYEQIIADLKEAESLLSTDFLDGGLRKYVASVVPERVRPSKWAAAALLARVYLYIGDYVNAELTASSLIDNTDLFGLNALNDVFKKNSKEAIWQLQYVNTGMFTADGNFFNLTSAGLTESNPVYLSSFLLDAFDDGDGRKMLGNWVNSITVSGTTYYFPHKYKSRIGVAQGTEYSMMLRLGEQYLIRAEARCMQNKISAAVEDVNAIRSRARATPTVDVPDPLPALSASLTKEELLAAILHERRVELFTEWGHRWLDLKRTGKIDEVMIVVTPLKGGTWQTTDQLYPIPNADILRNPNLIQNSGY